MIRQLWEEYNSLQKQSETLWDNQQIEEYEIVIGKRATIHEQLLTLLKNRVYLLSETSCLMNCDCYGENIVEEIEVIKGIND